MANLLLVASLVLSKTLEVSFLALIHLDKYLIKSDGRDFVMACKLAHDFASLYPTSSFSFYFHIQVNRLSTNKEFASYL